MQPGLSSGIVRVWLARYGPAHLANKAVSVQHKSTCFLGNPPLESRCGFGVKEQILAGREVCAVVVSEDLKPFLRAKLTNTPRPFTSVSRGFTKVVRCEDFSNVRKDVSAEASP